MAQSRFPLSTKKRPIDKIRRSRPTTHQGGVQHSKHRREAICVIPLTFRAKVTPNRGYGQSVAGDLASRRVVDDASRGLPIILTVHRVTVAGQHRTLPHHTSFIKMRHHRIRALSPGFRAYGHHCWAKLFNCTYLELRSTGILALNAMDVKQRIRASPSAQT